MAPEIPKGYVLCAPYEIDGIKTLIQAICLPDNHKHPEVVSFLWCGQCKRMWPVFDDFTGPRKNVKESVQWHHSNCREPLQDAKNDPAAKGPSTDQ